LPEKNDKLAIFYLQNTTYPGKKEFNSPLFRAIDNVAEVNLVRTQFILYVETITVLI